MKRRLKRLPKSGGKRKSQTKKRARGNNDFTDGQADGIIEAGNVDTTMETTLNKTAAALERPFPATSGSTSSSCAFPYGLSYDAPLSFQPSAAPTHPSCSERVLSSSRAQLP